MIVSSFGTAGILCNGTVLPGELTTMSFIDLACFFYIISI